MVQARIPQVIMDNSIKNTLPDQSVYSIWVNPGIRKVPAIQHQAAMMYRMEQVAHKANTALEVK